MLQKACSLSPKACQLLLTSKANSCQVSMDGSPQNTGFPYDFGLTNWTNTFVLVSLRHLQRQTSFFALELHFEIYCHVAYHVYPISGALNFTEKYTLKQSQI